MPQSKMPHLRFKGFSGEWEESELGNKVEFFSGLTYSPKDVTKDRRTLVLRSSNVKNGKIIDADNVYVNSNAVNCDNVQKGDIAVVVRNGSRSLIGKHAQIKEEMNNTVIGAFMTGVRSEQSSYINILLDTQKFNNEIEKNLGATINQITTGSFKKMIFSFPEINEQTKIGDYFQRLDALIEQKEKKCQKLKQFKTAMLSQLFPKEGEHTPALRFKGFSGEWEENKLKDIATFYNGRAYKQFELLKNGKYTVLRVGNFFTNDSWYYSDLELDDNKYCNDGDLLYAWSASFGPRIWKGGKVIYHYHIWKVENHEQVAKQFLFILLDNETAKIKRKSTNGFALLHITKETIENWSIKLPSNIEEQTKIGNYFQKLDTLIDLHHQELEKLKNTKKALLAKMFV